MLDFIGRFNALAAELAVHLLLSHLTLDQAPVERQELVMVLDQF